jgi:hypothetical protein
VAFTAINQTGNKLVQFAFDGLGSGAFAASTPTFDGMTVTYTGAGLVFPALRATDEQGNTYTATTLVNVEDPAAVTARFRAQWANFKARLAARDLPGALAHLTPTAQERFGPIFQTLSPNLPTIAAGLGDVDVTGVTSTLAEVALVQQRDGVPRLFFIYFRRNAVGQWFIEEM